MSTNLEPPRSLKGRRTRAIYRQLARELSARMIVLHAGTAALLCAYVVGIAEIEADPAGATADDLKDLRLLGRSIGLTS